MLKTITNLQTEFKLPKSVLKFKSGTSIYSTLPKTLTVTGKCIIKVDKDGTVKFIPLIDFVGTVSFTFTYTDNSTEIVDFKVEKAVATVPTPVPSPTPSQVPVSVDWFRGLNSSKNYYGPTLIKALRSPTDICQVGEWLYVATGYPEDGLSVFRLKISDPTELFPVDPPKDGDRRFEVSSMCTDGIDLYLACFDPSGYEENEGYSSRIDCAVIKLDGKTGEQKRFTKGQEVYATWQKDYNAYISSIAVKTNDVGKRPKHIVYSQGRIGVYFHDFTFETYHSSLGNYENSTTYFSFPHIATYNGLTMCEKEVTYNGKVICKAQTSPLIDNYTYTPYDFNTFEVKGAVHVGTDGTLWVVDAGNCRILHYTSDGQFINKIEYQPMCYDFAADRNNPTRVFVGFKEYKLTYPKSNEPLINIKFELVANWSWNLGSEYKTPHDLRNCMRDVVTVNGETIALIDKYTKFEDYSERVPTLFILNNSEGLIKRQEFEPFENVHLKKDGTILIYDSSRKLGSTGKWVDYYIVKTIETYPTITEQSAGYMDASFTAVTDDGHYLVFNNRTNTRKNNHLEWVKGGKVVYKAAPSLTGVITKTPTQDCFIVDGISGEAASSSIKTCKNFVAWTHVLEGLDNGQGLIVSLYKDGKLILKAGKLQKEAELLDGKEAPREFCGNSFSNELVAVDDCLYYFGNCEHTGGISIFRFKGLL